MILDHRGRALTRRKQYGLVRAPVEYVLADPPAAGELEQLGDAIATERIDADQGSPTDDSPRID